MILTHEKLFVFLAMLKTQSHTMQYQYWSVGQHLCYYTFTCFHIDSFLIRVCIWRKINAVVIHIIGSSQWAQPLVSCLHASLTFFRIKYRQHHKHQGTWLACSLTAEMELSWNQSVAAKSVESFFFSKFELPRNEKQFLNPSLHFIPKGWLDIKSRYL